MSDRLLDAAPDLVALRPLVSRCRRVDLLARGGSVVRSAVPLHRAFTTGDTALPVPADRRHRGRCDRRAQDHRPDAAAKLPDDMDVTLSQIGASGFDKQIVSTVHWCGSHRLAAADAGGATAAGSALLREDRRRLISRTFGRAFMWLGGIIVGVILGATLASVLITDDIKGALTVAAWHEIDGRLWIIAALALVVGLIRACDGRHPVDPHHPAGMDRSGALADPATPTTRRAWIVGSRLSGF